MTEKCEFPVENRSRNYEGLGSLIKEVQKIARPVLGQNGFAQVELLSHWSEILGEELSYGIKPIALTFPTKERTGGTLKVRTAGGAFALLFEHQKTQVIEKINTYFGYPAIQQIKIEQGGIKLKPAIQAEPEWPLEEEELNKIMNKISSIEDESLRQKMLDIGIQLARKNKNA